MKENKDSLLEGTLEMLVLRALRRGPAHGYAIAEFIAQASDDVLQVEEGSLYPALHRLEAKGLVLSRWGTSENNRKAKFYRLTAAGTRRLSAQESRWERMATAINRVLRVAD